VEFIKSWHREAALMAAHGPIEVTAIAKALNKTRTTVSRFVNRPDVRAFIDQLRAEKEAEIRSVVTDRHTTLINKAWASLEQILDDPEAGSSAKVTAALGILKGTGELVERSQQEIKGVFGVIIVDE
jgi:DNA-binding MarR family transcriptional regulator